MTSGPRNLNLSILKISTALAVFILLPGVMAQHAEIAPDDGDFTPVAFEQTQELTFDHDPARVCPLFDPEFRWKSGGFDPEVITEPGEHSLEGKILRLDPAHNMHPEAGANSILFYVTRDIAEPHGTGVL